MSRAAAKMLNLLSVHKATLLLLVFAISVFHALAPYLLLIFHTFPQTDDFILMRKREELGFIKLQLHEYIRWSGRYAMYLYFSLAFSLADPVRHYWIAIGAVFMMQFVGWAALLRCFMRLSHAIALSLLMVLACLQISPFPVQTFYWVSGAVVYQVPFATFLLALAFIIRLAQSTSPSLYRLVIPAYAMVILSCGGNEIFSVFIIIFLAVCAGICHLLALPGRRHISFLFLVSVISFGVMYIAPGNATRMARNSASIHDIFLSVTTAFFPSYRLLNLFFDHAWVWILGVGAMLWGMAQTAPAAFQRKGLMGSILCFAMALISVVLCNALYRYAMGNFRIPGRVLDFIMQLLLLFWLAGMSWLGVALGSHYRVSLRYMGYPFIWLIIGGIAIIGVYAHSNIRYKMAISDLRDAPLYHRMHMQWARKLEFTMNPRAIVALAATPVKPFHIYHQDPLYYHNHWINHRIGEYYSIRSVYIYDRENTHGQ